MVESDELVLNNSRFIGYAVKASSYEAINNAYTKLRMIHGGARHIVCAYSISLNDQTWGDGQCDDDEHCAARHLMRLIKEHKLKDTVLFRVRYYGGIHLGKTRFQLYTEVAEKALGILNPNIQMLSPDTLQPNIQTMPQRENPDASDYNYGSFIGQQNWQAVQQRNSRGNFQGARGSSYSSRALKPLPKPTPNTANPQPWDSTDIFSFSKLLHPLKTSDSWCESRWSEKDDWANDASEEMQPDTDYESVTSQWGHNNAPNASSIQSC